MARTQLRGESIEDGSIKRTDLNATTAGEAVIRKLIAAAGSNVSLTQTGVDAGTGDVTVTLTFKLTVSATAPTSPSTNDIWIDIT